MVRIRANAGFLLVILPAIFGWTGMARGAEGDGTDRAEKPAPDPADLAWMDEITGLPPGPNAALKPVAIHYRLSWNNVLNAGDLAVAVRRKANGNGDIDFVGTAEGRSSGLARALWSYDMKAESLVDAASLRPQVFRLSETERKKQFRYVLDFQPGKVLSETTRLASEEEPEETRSRVYRYEHLQDMMSLALYLRSFELPAGGDPVKILVSPFNRPYMVEFKVAGREKKKIKGVKYDTIRLDTKLRKIKPDQTLQEYEKMREATMWISDDEFRLPIEIHADIFVGFVSAQMTSRQWLPEAPLAKEAEAGAVPPPVKKAGILRKLIPRLDGKKG